MSIQSMLDARVAEIEAALRSRLGADIWVSAACEGGHYPSSRIFFSYRKREGVTYLSKARSIDEALTLALEAVAALRTYEDECADLGIIPERAPEIEEAA